MAKSFVFIPKIRFQSSLSDQIYNKIKYLYFCILEFIRLFAKKRGAWQSIAFDLLSQLVIINTIIHKHSC